MSVRKRKWITSKGETKEAWIVDYADQEGNRHIKTFDRKEDADDYRASVKVEIEAGVHTTGKVTVADAGKKWVADAEERALQPATVESYRQHLKQHIIPYIGAMKLSHVTVPAVRAFMDKLRWEGRSAAMVKRVVGDLGSILADAHERGMVAQNVVRSLSRRRKGKQAERRQKQKLKSELTFPRQRRSRR